MHEEAMVEPKPEDFDYELDHALSAMVGLKAIVPPDATAISTASRRVSAPRRPNRFLLMARVGAASSVRAILSGVLRSARQWPRALSDEVASPPISRSQAYAFLDILCSMSWTDFAGSAAAEASAACTAAARSRKRSASAWPSSWSGFPPATHGRELPTDCSARRPRWKRHKFDIPSHLPMPRFRPFCLLITACVAAPMAAPAQDVPFTVAARPWDAEQFGNHRAVVRVNDAGRFAHATLPWRRPDRDPDRKALIVTTESGQRIANVRRGEITQLAGTIDFEPVAGAGRYFVYGSHYEGAVPPGAIGIRLDASLAFGSGEHATTRGCLLAIDRRARQGSLTAKGKGIRSPLQPIVRDFQQEILQMIRVISCTHFLFNYVSFCF